MIIPNKTLIIVTSALNANIGVINQDDRFKQTLDGLLSLRKKLPDALVLLCDGSPTKIDPKKVETLSRYVNIVADFSGDSQLKEFLSKGLKSEAENILLIKTFMLLKNDHGLMKMMSSVNRIFKLSARTDILENFDLEEHNQWGKYVFKKRIPTWLSDSRSQFATDLLITRMFSLCPSLINDYIDVMHQNINIMLKTKIDTEHAHFFNVKKDYLVELDKIHCRGTVATTGTVENY
jgi:hypothetical protein